MTVTNDRITEGHAVDHGDRVELSARGGVRRRIAGAPAWAGFAVGLSAWIVLELLLAAVDLVPLGLGAGGFETNELWWTGGASVLALLIGGAVAGFGSASDRATDGALQGVVAWAISIVAIVVLSALGAGIGFGAFGESLQNAEAQSQLQPGQQQQAEDQGFVLSQSDAQQAAGLSVLFLALTGTAAVIGGAAGSKASGDGNRREIDIRT